MLAYFACNNALGDLYTAYFYNNIFLYRNVSDSIPLSGIIPYSLILTFIKLSKNLYMAAAILISIIFFIIKKRFAELISYLTLFLFNLQISSSCRI